MNVLHVAPGLDPVSGGTSMAVLALVQAQASVGLDVSVAYSFVSEEDVGADALRQHGIKLHGIGRCRGPLARHPRMVPILSKTIAQADVVHVHAMWEEIQYQGARLARRMRKPYIITPHGMLDAWSLAQSRFKKMIYLALRMRRILNAANAIHFTSRAERDSSSTALRPTTPKFVLPLGINLSDFHPLPPPENLITLCPALADRRIVLYLGRIHQGKGLELLVPALARCGVDDAMLLIVGPDSDGFKSQVEALARQQGVADRLVFTGMLRGEHRLEALVGSDLLALPSFHENFGLVVVEALACGTPVVISDQVNIHHEVAEAGVGAVVPTEVAPLAEALRRWLTDDALRQGAARRAADFARQTYDLATIAQQWRDQYRQIVEAHRAVGVATAAPG